MDISKKIETMCKRCSHFYIGNFANSKVNCCDIDDKDRKFNFSVEVESGSSLNVECFCANNEGFLSLDAIANEAFLSAMPIKRI